MMPPPHPYGADPYGYPPYGHPHHPGPYGPGPYGPPPPYYGGYPPFDPYGAAAAGGMYGHPHPHPHAHAHPPHPHAGPYGGGYGGPGGGYGGRGGYGGQGMMGMGMGGGPRGGGGGGGMPGQTVRQRGDPRGITIPLEGVVGVEAQSAADDGAGNPGFGGAFDGPGAGPMGMGMGMGMGGSDRYHGGGGGGGGGGGPRQRGGFRYQHDGGGRSMAPTMLAPRSPLLDDFRTGRMGVTDAREVAGHLADFAQDHAGHKFVLAKLTSGLHEEKEAILRDLLPVASTVMVDPFGHLVIERLLEGGTLEQRRVEPGNRAKAKAKAKR